MRREKPSPVRGPAAPGDSGRTPGGALNCFTLSFAEPGLESRYQADAVAGTIREAPLGTASSVLLWLVAGAVIPNVTVIPTSVAIPASITMAVAANLLALVPLRRIKRLNDALFIVLAAPTSQRQS